MLYDGCAKDAKQIKENNMLLLSIFIPLFMIIIIHVKTDNVKEISIAWGVIYSIVFILSGGWSIAPFVGLSAFAIAWLMFSLANYLEENIFLRIIVLFSAIEALFKVPLLVVSILPIEGDISSLFG